MAETHTEKREKMEQRAINALQRTWDAIGYDALQCAVDCGEADDINDVVMSQEEVIDMVSSCGFRGSYPMTYGNDKEAVLWLDQQPEAVQNDLLNRAFPHSRYGA